jgi:hypothetical protein
MKIAEGAPCCVESCWHVENLFSPPGSSSSRALVGCVTVWTKTVFCVVDGIPLSLRWSGYASACDLCSCVLSKVCPSLSVMASGIYVRHSSQGSMRFGASSF